MANVSNNEAGRYRTENADYIVREDNGYEDNGYKGNDYGNSGCEAVCETCEPDMAGQSSLGTADDIHHPSASRFWETKRYLHRVRDGVRRCSLLEQRINLRLNDPDGSEFPDTNALDDELLEAEQQVNDAKIEITDLISNLSDVNQQMVVTERYVNMKTWEKIAQDMNTSVRIVQKIHGKALPLIEKLIGENEATECQMPSE